jgi:hypothetical protein
MLYLYELPNWLIATLIIGATIGASLLAQPFVHRVLRIHRLSAHHFVLAITIHSTVVALAAFVLGFAAVEARNTFDDISRSLVLEAHEISELDQNLARYGTATQPAHEALIRYTKSIIDDEWPALVAGAPGSPKTTALFRTLSQQISALEPTTMREGILMREILQHLQGANRARDERLDAAANAGLPSLFWAALIGINLVVIAIGGLLQRSRAIMYLLASQGAALGILLAFLFIIDQPYIGETSVSPAPFQQVLTEISVHR